MQKVNASFRTTGADPKKLGEKKGFTSFIHNTKKGVLTLGISVFALSAIPAFSSVAAPTAAEEDILVFSDEGEIVSQNDQTVELFTSDVLSGDTQSRSQQVVDYAMQFLGRPYKYGGVSLLNGSDCSGFLMGIFGHLPSSFFCRNSLCGGKCRWIGKCNSG